MARCSVLIVNDRGLHARAAAKFVQAAERFDAAVEVANQNGRVSGLSIMGLLMLGAACGSEIEIYAEGPAADAAVAALADLVASGFGEGVRHH